VQSSLHKKIDHTRERFATHTPAHHNLWPFRSRISMSCAACLGSDGRGAVGVARSVGNTVGVLTVTGSSVASSFAACGFSNPRRCRPPILDYAFWTPHYIHKV
jgi:hypothetical protein